MLTVFFHKSEIHCSIETYGVKLSFFVSFFLLSLLSFFFWMMGAEKIEDLESEIREWRWEEEKGDGVFSKRLK